MPKLHSLNRAVCEGFLGNVFEAHIPSLIATRVERRGEDIALIYHGTTVVRFTAEGVILNTGGFETATTKARMNSALFGTPYIVASEKQVWYVFKNGLRYAPFEDGMLLVTSEAAQ